MQNQNVLIYLSVVVFLVYLFQTFFPRKENPIIKVIKHRLGKIDPNLSKIPIFVNDESYTINKKAIFICIKDPKTNDISHINTLMYVVLHEIAHMYTTETEYFDNGKVNEHGPVFKSNLDKLLELAHTHGVYDKTIPFPQTYCGNNHLK